MKKLKKSRKKLIALIAVILVAAAAVVSAVRAGGSGGRYLETMVQARDIISYLEFSGNIEASDVSTVYASVTAQVTEVPVEEGDWVEAGDVIAVLDSSDVEYNISLQEANLKQAQLSDSYNIKDSQTSLDNLNTQLEEGLNSTLNTAQETLLSAQESYQTAVETYNRAKEELEGGTNQSVVSARQSLASAQASYDSAVNQHENHLITDEALATYAVTLSNAQESLRLAEENAEKEVQDYYDDMVSAEESLADAERDYEAAELSMDQNVQTSEEALEKTQALASQEATEIELEHLRESLDDYTITAPISGYITDLSLKEGEYTASAAAAAEVTSFDTMQVKVKISEYDVGKVKEGDAVQIHLDALDKDYEGTISRISRTATVENEVSYLDAVVEFDADDEVRDGLSAEVRLIRDQELGVPALPSEAIAYHDDNTAYVYIRDDAGKVVEQPVTLGATDGTWVQIADGLEMGETVLYVYTPSYADLMMMAAQ
ncbi:MAG TPA: efflux RND transporter periplasmic adaptor subunit [Candidatus Eisenbergiella merdipullorum]|uniref:Efflux RND transporter periplasmic adaptor subunit n=1 Tax=Candidatus Eisenbergiella merdipullorum TaxID=2838553 RepID=A0A9D2I3Y1_9FIRM|nr:efflux RND transporter periplasmic adaptor subunit [Candidatus Eisenbergiella merdipullorum]